MANYFIIGGDKKEYGPITAGDVRQWIAEGRLNAQSLAKAEGEASWSALGTIPEFAGSFGAGAPPTIAPPAIPSLDGDNWQAEVTARTPELRLGECLGAGWSFLGNHAGFAVGAVFLTWLVNFALAFIALYVPIIGPIAVLCLSGVVFGGFYLACLRRMRGEAVAPTEVFAGFQIAFVQLLLVGLVGGLLVEFSVCCLVLPAIYLMVAWAFAVILVAEKQMFFWSALELSRKVVTRVWFEVFVMLVIAFLPVLIFQLYNLYEGGMYFLGIYHQANGNWQQMAQNLQSQSSDLRAMALKGALIGQIIQLVTLFYSVGVMIRAYENLFGTRKP